MPTPKQKEAAKLIAENIGSREGIGGAMRKAGYSKSTSLTPQRLTETKGFKEAIKEYGLTEELITCSLVDDIKAKPLNRLGELRLGSEILGMKLEDNSTTINIHNYTDEQSKRIAERALQKVDN